MYLKRPELMIQYLSDQKKLGQYVLNKTNNTKLRSKGVSGTYKHTSITYKHILRIVRFCNC